MDYNMQLIFKNQQLKILPRQCIQDKGFCAVPIISGGLNLHNGCSKVFFFKLLEK